MGPLPRKGPFSFRFSCDEPGRVARPVNLEAQQCDAHLTPFFCDRPVGRDRLPRFDCPSRRPAGRRSDRGRDTQRAWSGPVGFRSILSLSEIAGYLLAAGSFLGLAATLKGGVHIRVTMLISNVPLKVRSVA